MTETAKIETDKHLVQTRSQTKSSGVKVPDIHGIDKGLNLHVKQKKTEISSNTASRQKTTYSNQATPYPSLELDKEELDL